jgi:hypothetical protein
MNLDRYEYFNSNNYLDYEFYSEGPNGKIKKAIRFIKINDEPIIYNLGFGDVSEDNSVIDDDIVSNNEDKDKVLATIANTIIDFSSHHGNHYIFATGSTSSRTRLYQMSIASLWNEISTNFYVYGLINGSWHEFQRNVNYEAFLVKKKQVNIFE